ncbi:MAG: WbqC family protein [Phycisphaerae bacterium]|nr:WbqC family protein [Phycisphaerae bacterium]
MRGAILQPTYLPWAGYFEMIGASEIFVVFDHVQFVKKSWHQRNKIKGPNGEILLTVPVKKGPRDSRICDIEICCDGSNPLEKHWNTISRSYSKSRHFRDYESVFTGIYSEHPKYLRDLNVRIITTICNLLGIKTKMVFSSELNLAEENMDKSERIAALCEKVGITHLYDAKGAQEFLDTSRFADKNIAISFQNYEHPQYSQLFDEFIPYMSVIDLLFNEGQNSLEIIRSGRKEPFTG